MGIETIIAAAALGTSVAGTVGSARAAKEAGAAQQQQYNAQAAQAQMQGRSQAIAYRQQGADVLRSLNETLAATIAIAGAGNIDPTSGSARVLQEYARAEASSEFGTAQENAILATAGATAQAGIYRQAGSSAMRAGIMQGNSIMFTGLSRSLSLMPTFNTAAPMASNPTYQGGPARST
jgi:hypothetical protein